jgi:hypothetical protein
MTVHLTLRNNTVVDCPDVILPSCMPADLLCVEVGLIFYKAYSISPVLVSCNYQLVELACLSAPNLTKLCSPSFPTLFLSDIVVMQQH